MNVERKPVAQIASSPLSHRGWNELNIKKTVKQPPMPKLMSQSAMQVKASHLRPFGLLLRNARTVQNAIDPNRRT